MNMDERPDFLAGDTYIPDPPQEDHPDEPKKVLKLARHMQDNAETILKLAKSRWYVEEDAYLLDLADDLSAFQNIQVVGVVNASGKVKGIIIRKDIFDLLGRPFGRDVLKKETVSTVATSVKSFFCDTSVYSVSEEIGKMLQAVEVSYFPLKTIDGEFVGIFSSQDLLVYLSQIARKDVQFARSVQTRIVKELSVIENEFFSALFSSSTSQGLGGDFYHIKGLDNARWSFSIADASGKGTQTSFIVSALGGIINSFDLNKGPKSLVAHINRIFIDTFDNEKFLTGLFCEIDTSSGQLVACDQGHGYGYFFRAGKLLKMKTNNRSFPIGVSNDLRPEAFRYPLMQNDLIFFSTDGLLEQTNTTGQEYGLLRIKTIFAEHGDLPLSDLRETILKDVDDFRGEAPVRDDITFMLIRYR